MWYILIGSLILVYGLTYIEDKKKKKEINKIINQKKIEKKQQIKTPKKDVKFETTIE